ncbi:MAG: hypothetical protein KC425_05495 [Anaerolineales bacterium]|nr:hypothetical protein [Anaerolineales bacterium]
MQFDTTLVALLGGILIILGLILILGGVGIITIRQPVLVSQTRLSSVPTPRF